MERDFLTQFTFNNTSCICEIERVIDDTNDSLVERLALKKGVNETIKMGYVYGSGLKVLGDRIKRDKNNVLGEFLGIKKDDYESYKSYFEKYGFLFKLKGEEYWSVNTDDLFYLQQSLLAFIQLMNNQYDADLKKQINVQELLDASLYLIFREQNSICINNETFLEINSNYLIEIINNAAEHQDATQGLKFEDRTGQKIPYFEIDDSVYGVKQKIDQEYYINIIEHNHLPHWCKNVLRIYKNKQQIIHNKKWHIVLDFLYHFIFELTPFRKEDIALDGTFEDEVYEKLQNDECLLDALIETSKLLLSEEFKNNLATVNPIYNIEDMKPDWNLPSLFSAMYFSLFYLDSSQVGLRKCANSSCQQYFEVSKTNSRKKYCDSYTCGNTVNQRNYQKKRKLLK